ncbi:MAG: glycosyltransferase [Spartobacteria bacterium]|nr:glycosyltransferase [Spartobacteria bacterium]
MNERVHILFVLADLRGGGTERFFSMLLNLLPQDVYDCHLGVWRDATDYPIPDSVIRHDLRKARPWDLPGVIQRTRNLVRQLRPDLVVSGHYFTNLATGEAMRPLFGAVPWLARFGNPPEIEMRGWKRLWARRVLPVAATLIGNSQGVCDSLHRNFGVEEGRTCLLPNLLALPQGQEIALKKRSASAPFVFLNMGRLHSQKNQMLLLRAFARLKRTDVRLVLLGQGPMRSALEREIARLGLTGAVTMPGFNPDVAAACRAADCFVLSSNWEGSPNSLIEAMACGLPVISTDCPYGPSELITPGVNGLLAPPGDEAALAGAMRIMMDHPAQRAAMAKAAARTISERFDNQRTLAQIRRLFDSVLREKGRP